MSAKKSITVQFGTFVKYEEVEAAMQREYSNSRPAKGLVLDLSDTGFISPQALCTLHCWAFDVRSRGGETALIPPSGGHQASSFFSSAGVLSVLSRGPAFENIAEPSRLGARPRYLSSFEVFQDGLGLEAYLENLSDLRTRHLILHVREESQLIDSGDYHDILIRELVGNSHVHAEGVGSVCASYGFESSGEQIPPLLAEFRSSESETRKTTRDQDEKGYLPYAEICVADSYESNLWDQVSKLLDEDRVPEFDYIIDPESQAIDEHALDILAAFNYASTSDQTGRIDRIRRYITDWNGEASAIATGLYRVRRLIELYGAQVIVRTDRRVVSLDYSGVISEELRPRVGCIRRLNRRQLAPLCGTLVCVRIPLEPRPLEREYAARKTKLYRTKSFKAKNIEIVTAPLGSVGDEASTAHPSLDQFEKVVRARIGNAAESSFSFVLLDGFPDEYQVSRNLLVPFIDLLSLVPRRCGLAVIADDETVASVHRAAPELLKAAEEQPLETRAGLVVVGSDRLEPCQLGDRNSPGSTSLEEEEIVGPTGARAVLKGLADSVRARRLREVLVSEEVLRKEEGHLYLIPNRYYTDRYFEVDHLARAPTAFSTLCQWFAERVAEHQPSAIVTNSRFLLCMANIALQRASDAVQRDTFYVSRDNVLTVAAKCNASCRDTGSVLAVLDVVCTGEVIKRFLDVFSRPSNVTILALVDSRTTTEPFQVIEDSQYVQVDVQYLLREPLEPIRDRGDTSALRIHRADPETHLLLQKPGLDIPEGGRQPHDNLALLEKASAVNALAAGHFTFRDQHHAYFLSLSPIFRAIETDIIEWLTELDDCELSELSSTREVDPSRLQVFCLDADTGLYQIVSRALERTQITRASLLTRSDLRHPPAASSEIGRPLWFILPALVDGTSFYECLRFAAESNAPLAQVSVVLDRTSPRVNASLAGVRTFSRTKVQYGRMFGMPISLEDGTCSLCDQERRLQGAALAARHGSLPHLHSVLDNARNAARAIPVENPGLVSTTGAGRKSERLLREFAARSLLEQAVDGDIQATWDLRKQLVDLGGFSALAAAASSSPRSLFTRERVADVLHETSLKVEDEERLTLSDACAGWAEQASSEHDPDSFGRELRGFAHLDPFTLRGHIPGLLERIAANPVLLSELIGEAATHPSLYLDAIENIDPSICKAQEMENALGQLKIFLMYEGGRVPALHWLRHHLLQSSGWSYSLSRMQQEAGNPGSTGMDMETICQVFLHRGLQGVQQRLMALRSGKHWEALQEAENLDSHWADVEDRAKELVRAIRGGLRDSEPIARKVSKITDATQSFVDALDNSVSLAPEMIEALFRIPIGTKSWPSEALRVIVPRDCKPIACGVEDFREMLQHLLDNARRYDKPDRTVVTTLEFHPAPANASRVVMEVSQNAPVSIPDQKAFLGGLRTVEELITEIAGMPPALRSCERDEAYLIAKFWAWPLRGGEKIQKEVQRGENPTRREQLG